MQKPLNINKTRQIPGFILNCILYGSILYYLYNLEDADCNCIRDWRHNFIKAMCFITIFMGLIFFIFAFNIKIFITLYIIQLLLFVVLVYAFFTYVSDLNTTQCVCAVKKQPNLNSIMNVLRFILLFILIITILIIILFASLINTIIKSLKK